MIEDGKVSIVEWHTTDREYLTVRTVTNELFSIAKPKVSGERLAAVEQVVHEVLEQGKKGAENG